MYDNDVQYHLHNYGGHRKQGCVGAWWETMSQFYRMVGISTISNYQRISVNPDKLEIIPNTLYCNIFYGAINVVRYTHVHFCCLHWFFFFFFFGYLGLYVQIFVHAHDPPSHFRPKSQLVCVWWGGWSFSSYNMYICMVALLSMTTKIKSKHDWVENNLLPNLQEMEDHSSISWQYSIWDYYKYSQIQLCVIIFYHIITLCLSHTIL